jgi:hypothetical protein
VFATLKDGVGGLYVLAAIDDQQRAPNRSLGASRAIANDVWQ